MLRSDQRRFSVALSNINFLVEFQNPLSLEKPKQLRDYWVHNTAGPISIWGLCLSQ